MAFRHPRKLDQMDLPFHAVHDGWMSQIFLDPQCNFSMCLLFFDFHTYQLLHINVSLMFLQEFPSVECAREDRQDGWVLHLMCIVTALRKAQAGCTISVS